MMKIQKTKSIRTRFLRSFLLVSLIPLLVVATIQYFFALNLLVQGEEQTLQHVTEGRSQGINEWMKGKVNEVRLAAQSEEITSLDPAKQLALANKVKALDDLYEAAVFIDIEGVVRAHTTEKQINNQSLWEREYFQDGLKGKETVTNILVSNVSGNRMFTISVPVYNEAQSVIGVFIATVNFERLVGEFFKEDDLSRTMLVDSANTIQMHPNKELIGSTIEDAYANSDWLQFITQGKKQASYETLALENDQTLIFAAPIEVSNYGLYTMASKKEVESVIIPMQTTCSIIIVLSMLIITLIAIYRARTFSQPVVEVSQHLQAIAAGDLTHAKITVRTRDEIGQLGGSLNTMHSNLEELIVKIRQSSKQVSESAQHLETSADQSNIASDNIAQTIENIALGAETQMTSVDRTVELTEELAIKIGDIVKDAASTSNLSNKALHKAEEGNDIIQLTVKQMESIFTTMQGLSTAISEMGQRSREIDQIVEVISTISEQTNLLSLNASIEAARAGEQGKGFAVVANEVRVLAEQSAESAHKITRLISNIQTATNESLIMMEKGQKEVEKGVQIAHNAGQLFQEIRSELDEVTKKTVEVSSFAHDVQTNATNVNNSIHGITTVSHKTLNSTQAVAAQSEEQLASVQEITASAHGLSDMADELNDMIRKFKVK